MELQIERDRLAAEIEQFRESLESLRNRNAELESRIQKQSAALTQAQEALERSHLELQQFAYITSHDLQSPLRGIAGFARFLWEDYDGKLDETADEYLAEILASTRWMQRLLDDLLTYSRVGSRAKPFAATDLADVFDHAVSLLRGEIERANGEVTCGELATVVGDRAQLSQLLQNLIGNALTFRADDPPRVHVSCERNGECTIAVRDNGIGIDAKHHEQIFEIFRRLHTQEQYPGTGMGLAVCRRIVSRHGGRIWVESEIGKGSAFYFTIPDRVS